MSDTRPEIAEKIQDSLAYIEDNLDKDRDRRSPTAKCSSTSRPMG